jgi:hypothetical protein
MVDLFVLTSLDELLLILKQYFFLFFTKQPILMRKSTVLHHPFHIVFHEYATECGVGGYWKNGLQQGSLTERDG